MVGVSVLRGEGGILMEVPHTQFPVPSLSPHRSLAFPPEAVSQPPTPKFLPGLREFRPSELQLPWTGLCQVPPRCSMVCVLSSESDGTGQDRLSATAERIAQSVEGGTDRLFCSPQGLDGCLPTPTPPIPWRSFRHRLRAAAGSFVRLLAGGSCLSLACVCLALAVPHRLAKCGQSVSSFGASGPGAVRQDAPPAGGACGAQAAVLPRYGGRCAHGAEPPSWSLPRLQSPAPYPDSVYSPTCLSPRCPPSPIHWALAEPKSVRDRPKRGQSSAAAFFSFNA